MRRSALLVSLLLLTALPALADDAAVDQDWPQYRGHVRDGISHVTGLLDAWPEHDLFSSRSMFFGGAHVAWRSADGASRSSRRTSTTCTSAPAART